MYFYGGFRQAVWLLTTIPLNFIYSYLFFKNYVHIIYQYCIATNFSCCFLEIFHLVLLFATTWRPNLCVLRKIWLSECLPFDNHKLESWIPCHLYLYYIFSKNPAVLKNYNILFPQKCLYLQDILLTCNVWIYLCWTHFYNLVAWFRTLQRPKTFVMFSGFLPLRGCGGGGLSEYIKICGENVAVAI